MKRSIIAILLCVSLLVSVAAPVFAADSDIVTITVNYVYYSTKAMVSQPYSAQIAKGSEFSHDVACPTITNYSIDMEAIEGLTDGITYTADKDNNGTLHFDLKAVNSNITINVYYFAGKTTYTVKHYYQNLENDKYAEPSEEDGTIVYVTGDIDAYTQAAQQTRQGFVCTGIPTGTVIAADGSTSVSIYYDRAYYTVVFDPAGGVNGPAPIYGKFGSSYDTSKIVPPTRSGYVFNGWNVTPTGLITENQTYVAQWIPAKDNADYKIVYWGQNADLAGYTYMGVADAFGIPGETITYSEDTYICSGAHVHGINCYTMTCNKPEHTHSDSCGLNCQHIHDATCYGASSETTVSRNVITAFSNLLSGGLQNGYIYRIDCDALFDNHGNHYYLYYNNKWYASSADNVIGGALAYKSGNFAGDHMSSNRETVYVYRSKLNCTHNHIDTCYQCGLSEHRHSEIGGNCYSLTCDKTAHTHTAACHQMGEYSLDKKEPNLWHFSHADSVEVNADGSTVLNVYFDRNVFTIKFFDGSTQVYQIDAPWGSDVSSHWPIVGTNGKTYGEGQRWKPSGSNIYSEVLVFIHAMPAESFTLKLNTSSASVKTMNYYFEVLPGTTGTTSYSYGGVTKRFTLGFTVKANYNYITEAEDFFEIVGYNKWTSNPRFSYGEIDSRTADFYYTRVSDYKITFYSASKETPDKVVNNVTYGVNIGGFDYTPTAKPMDVEQANAVFYGWYLNPECSGEKYVLSAHTMPAGNISLYARWVNGLFTIRTFTDADMKTLYTYDDYDGIIENVIKYEWAPPPADPEKENNVFIGWFYRDAEGKEQPFSFALPITQDYDLYPKFSNRIIVDYTVHYYLNGTTTKIAEDEVHSAMIGTTVTECAKVGAQLDLIPMGDSYNNYYPNVTSTSMELKAAGMELIFFYRKASSVPYTVRYVMQTGVDTFNNPIYEDIAPAKVVSDNKHSVVTENYLPIEGFTPDYFQKTLELTWNSDSNVLMFIYTPDYSTLTITKSCAYAMDPGQTFVFRIQGVSGIAAAIDMTVTISGTGSLTITDLPLGDYTVTEDTSWSWRYTPDSAVKEVTVAALGSEVTFVNSLTDTSSVQDAYDFIRNIFD